MPQSGSARAGRTGPPARPAESEPVPLARKVALLCRPDSYAEPADPVDAIETRHSWVFLTACFAWKLKKPLRYGGLDLGHPEGRRRDCLEEVRLNAPLAPGVYRGVVPLTLAADGTLALDGGGTAVDHLVCMRRLPRAACLDDGIARGEVPPDTVDRAAARLAAYYIEAPEAGGVDVAGLSAAIAAEADALQELPLPRPQDSERLRDGLRHWIDRHAATLARRRRVDAHGDLRPQHVYLTEPPVFVDRLTFARDLRLLDPAEELAFLALDCERLGAGWVGERFLRAHASAAGAAPPPALVAFYRARRGLLWTLLSGRHLREGDTERPWETIAADYRRLALDWLPAA